MTKIKTSKKLVIKPQAIKYGYFKVPGSTKVPQATYNRLVKAFGADDDVRDKLSEVFGPTNLNGYIIIALHRPNKIDNAQKHIASFCFCSPLDSFKKSIARTIASGRLINRRNKEGVVRFKYSGKITGAFEMALGLAIQNGLAPGWVIRAFKAGNIVYSLREQSPEASE